MKKAIILVALSIIIGSGCSIEQQLERREDRLIGTWVIERAWFNQDWTIFRDVRTSEYENDEVTFFENGELEYILGDGTVYTGFWYLEALRGVSQDDDTEFLIDAEFYEVNGSDSFRWIGNITLLTWNNFNIRIAERNGELVLKWDKV